MNKINKVLPVLFENKIDCCSCSACMCVCPVGAIVMKEDSQGFIYPIIDDNKCIRCYICMKKCPLSAK